MSSLKVTLWTGLIQLALATVAHIRVALHHLLLLTFLQLSGKYHQLINNQ